MKVTQLLKINRRLLKANHTRIGTNNFCYSEMQLPGAWAPMPQTTGRSFLCGCYDFYTAVLKRDITLVANMARNRPAQRVRHPRFQLMTNQDATYLDVTVAVILDEATKCCCIVW